MLDWLEQTPVAQWVAASAWGYPITLTTHGVGMAVVVGVVLMIGLRVIGFFKSIPLEATRQLLPYMWLAFVLNFISGVGLFIADAERFFNAPTFQVKILFIATGLVMVTVLDLVYLKPALQAGPAPARPLAMKVVEIVLFVLLLLANLATLLWLFAVNFPELSAVRWVFVAVMAAAAIGALALWGLDLGRSPTAAPILNPGLYSDLLTGLFVFMLAADILIAGWWVVANFTQLDDLFVGLTVGTQALLSVLLLLCVALVAAIVYVGATTARYVFVEHGRGEAGVIPASGRMLAVVTIAYWWLAVILSGRLIAYLTA